jgi:serine/threonine protein kinase
MVMEYFGFGNLRQYISNPNSPNYSKVSVKINETKEYNKLGFEKKISHLTEIAKGLNSIHKQGLIHRDLHAGNILCDGGYLNIVDFGLCRPVDETDKSKVFGILPYVAPELLRKKENELAPYTQKSDIYSFGIIAYEILTGLPPYAVYDEKEEVYNEIPYDRLLG